MRGKYRKPFDLEKATQLRASGMTIREISKAFGASHSRTQRRLALQVEKAVTVVAPEREAVGPLPLPAGHPISWGAICSMP